MKIHYRVKVTPLPGTEGHGGACVIEDITTARDGESPEQCVQREAAEAGWQLLEIQAASVREDVEPYKIEIEVRGRWVELGTDNNREYVCHRVKWTDEHFSHFMELLRLCGWSGPDVGSIRLRHANTGEILTPDQCNDERRKLEDNRRR